jgi:hypothetical protein
MTVHASHSKPVDSHAGENTPSLAEPVDPWAPGNLNTSKTFREMYLDGDSPWPEEPLLQHDPHPFEIADEYLSLLGQYTRAEQDSDGLAVRRLRGELDVADAALTHMDSYSQAAVLTRLTSHLTRAAHTPQPRAVTAPKPGQVLPDKGRFNGPAPFFRRGRAYIQALSPAFRLAAEGHGEFVGRRPEDADQFLRAVEASDDVADLQDFIAGAVHEIHRQLHQLVGEPISVAVTETLND